MLEAVEVGASVARDAYEAALPQLRVDLVNAQFDLREAPFAVLVVLAGDDWMGVDETLDVLHEWMDARYLDTHTFAERSAEERARPWMYRYWRELPRRGGLAIHVGAWMQDLLVDRLRRRVRRAELERRFAHVRAFERALADDDVLLVKLWLHLPKKDFKKRIRRARRDPNARIPAEERAIYRSYARVRSAAEQALRETGTAEAPWTLVEAGDERHRNLTVARTLLDAITQRLAAATPATPPAPAAGPPPGLLATVDLSAVLPYDEYKERLEALQARLWRLTTRARRRGLPSVVVFEGWDAAGKGGCIRRMTRAMEARDYHVVPVSAPTEEEAAHHYLWRFWRRLPAAGQMTIFDRSWYGRVLVERVEGYAREAEWRRAYNEIDDFEAQLVEHGIPLVKFWLHLGPDEQKRRFEARAKTAYKKYKITGDDYRNRKRWDAYAEAADEMLARTSTDLAPWTLVSAQDKRFARVRVLETVCAALGGALR
jgi:polyphosphate:AMP phosphotransferase